eukprot:SAG22_NODE_914_length_6519_cov_1.701713_3_plen_91_part_00
MLCFHCLSKTVPFCAVQQQQSTTVGLVLTPKYHSVVKDEARESYWEPHIAVEAGGFTVHVGGGQPDFAQGVLSATVTVASEGPLKTSYTC